MSELPTPFEAFELAVARAGSESEFARMVGCTPGNINQLLKKKSQLSHRFVLKAEEATGVSRFVLRPDLYPAEASASRAVSGLSDRPANLEPTR